MNDKSELNWFFFFFFGITVITSTLNSLKFSVLTLSRPLTEFSGFSAFSLSGGITHLLKENRISRNTDKKGAEQVMKARYSL